MNMKKVFTLVAVLALTAPVFSGDVQVSVAGDGTINYTYTGDPPVGYGLIADTSGGSGNLGGAVGDAFFNVFIDFAHSNPAGYNIGDGHPCADPGGPGVCTTPATMIAVSAGELDVDNDAASPGTFGVLVCDDGECMGTLDADPLRGGIVDINGLPMTSNLPVDFTIGGGAVCAGDGTGMGTVQGSLDAPNGVVDIFDLQALANELLPLSPTFSQPTPAGLEPFDITGTTTTGSLDGPNGTLDIFDLQALANYLLPFSPTFSGPCIE